MKTEGEVPQLIRDLIYAREHRLLDNEGGRASVQALQHGVVDDLVRSLIQGPVRKHKIAQAFVGPFALPRLGRGELVLGIDLRGRPIRIPIQYLNGHTLTVGSTGSGKTTKSRFLTLQVAGKVRGLWCFDFVKREFAVLKPHLAQLGIKLLIVPARELRLNPLQCPDHVSPPDWAPRVADALVQVLQLPTRATKLLHVSILRLYRHLGVLDGSQHFPTLFELRETIANDTEANHQAKQAVVDSLDPVLWSIGEVLQYRIGWKTQDLAKRHIVFELGGTAEVDKNLILNSLVLPEFTSRVARGVSNPIMDLWICCDEAARLVSSTSPTGGISDLIGLIRGCGVGLDLSTQSADVMRAVLSNTAFKAVTRCGSARDYDEIGAAMGLNPEQRRWLNINLRPGRFVGQIGEGDWLRPFVFTIPRMHLDSRTHEETGSGGSDLGDLMALPTLKADEFSDWHSAKPTATCRSPAEVGNGQLSDAELRYIRTVVSNPGKPSSILPKLARISAKRAQKIRRHLVERGYFREHRVSTGKRGRASIVLEPLEPAMQSVREATTDT